MRAFSGWLSHYLLYWSLQVVFFIVGIVVMVLVYWYWPEDGLVRIDPDQASLVTMVVYLCCVWFFNTVYLSILVPETDAGTFIKFRLTGGFLAGGAMIFLVLTGNRSFALKVLGMSLFFVGAVFLVRAGLMMRQARKKRLEEIAQEG